MRASEFAGVALVIDTKIFKHIDDVYPVDGSIMSLALWNPGPTIHLMDIYAPAAKQNGLCKKTHTSIIRTI